MVATSHYPLVVFTTSVFTLWLAARIGRLMIRKRRQLDEELRADFVVILGAALTLLALIIGFSFSMSAARYDLRKNREATEANAIATEYVRTNLLPAADAEKARTLLKRYLDQRISFYRTEDPDQFGQTVRHTAQLETELWSTILVPAEANPTPVMALVVSGMNDVFNSQGFSQAGFWNRIPVATWGLMATIAISCNWLVGYGSRSNTAGSLLMHILPVLISIAFMFIADIDTPRSGMIRVEPQNLISLANSLD